MTITSSSPSTASKQAGPSRVKATPKGQSASRHSVAMPPSDAYSTGDYPIHEGRTHRNDVREPLFNEFLEDKIPQFEDVEQLMMQEVPLQKVQYPGPNPPNPQWADDAMTNVRQRREHARDLVENICRHAQGALAAACTARANLEEELGHYKECLRFLRDKANIDLTASVWDKLQELKEAEEVRQMPSSGPGLSDHPSDGGHLNGGHGGDNEDDEDEDDNGGHPDGPGEHSFNTASAGHTPGRHGRRGAASRHAPPPNDDLPPSDPFSDDDQPGSHAPSPPSQFIFRTPPCQTGEEHKRKRALDPDSDDDCGDEDDEREKKRRRLSSAADSPSPSTCRVNRILRSEGRNALQMDPYEDEDTYAEEQADLPPQLDVPGPEGDALPALPLRDPSPRVEDPPQQADQEDATEGELELQYPPWSPPARPLNPLHTAVFVGSHGFPDNFALDRLEGGFFPIPGDAGVVDRRRGVPNAPGNTSLKPNGEICTAELLRRLGDPIPFSTPFDSTVSSGGSHREELPVDSPQWQLPAPRTPDSRRRPLRQVSSQKQPEAGPSRAIARPVPAAGDGASVSSSLRREAKENDDVLGGYGGAPSEDDSDPGEDDPAPRAEPVRRRGPPLRRDDERIMDLGDGRGVVLNEFTMRTRVIAAEDIRRAAEQHALEIFPQGPARGVRCHNPPRNTPARQNPYTPPHDNLFQ